jgi:hypothetical protein
MAVGADDNDNGAADDYDDVAERLDVAGAIERTLSSFMQGTFCFYYFSVAVVQTRRASTLHLLFCCSCTPLHITMRAAV